MHLIRVNAGKVQTVLFGPGGRSLYLLAEVREDEGYGYLIEHAFRIDSHTGELLGDWRFPGSQAAVFSPDFRFVYHNVSVAVAGGELDLWRVDLVSGKQEFVYKSSVPYPSSLAF